MRTLLLAAILYLIGVVIVLLLRPQTMFDEDGDWREFGILSKAHTVFPFWLFCIVWAVLSYCITLFFLGAPGGADHSKKHVVDHLPVDEPERSNPRSGKRSKSGRRSKPVVEAPSDNLVEPLSPIEMTKGKKAPPKPGYYILDDIGTEVNGKPRYVYYGDKPPGSIGEE